MTICLPPLARLPSAALVQPAWSRSCPDFVASNWQMSADVVFGEFTSAGAVTMLQVALPVSLYNCVARVLRSMAIARALRTLRSDRNGCCVVGSDRLSPSDAVGSARLI